MSSAMNAKKTSASAAATKAAASPAHVPVKIAAADTAAFKTTTPTPDDIFKAAFMRFMESQHRTASDSQITDFIKITKHNNSLPPARKPSADEEQTDETDSMIGSEVSAASSAHGTMRQLYKDHAVSGLSTLAVKHALLAVARQNLIPHPKACNNCTYNPRFKKTWFCGDYKTSVVMSANPKVHEILAAKVRGLKKKADQDAALMGRGTSGMGRRRTTQAQPTAQQQFVSPNGYQQPTAQYGYPQPTARQLPVPPYVQDQRDRTSAKKTTTTPP